jgi:hypothetical protein
MRALQRLQGLRTALCPPSLSDEPLDYPRPWADLRTVSDGAAQVLAGLGVSVAR